MNRSYSKIRHIQEMNVLLEKKLLSEQTGITYGNDPAPIPGVTDAVNTQQAGTQTTDTKTDETLSTEEQPKEETPKEVQGKEKTAELVGTLQELLKNTYKQNIVVDNKYGPKTAQAILAALNTLKK